MKLISLTFAPVLALVVGCGAAVPVAAPTTTTAATAPVATPVTEAVAAPAPVDAPAAPAVEEAPEKCESGWVCVKVSFATRKVEKRETRLTGEQSTWSKQSDGRTATFDQFSRGPVSSRSAARATTRTRSS